MRCNYSGSSHSIYFNCDSFCFEAYHRFSGNDTTIANDTVEKSSVQYTVQQVDFGLLLLVYRNGRVCFVSQGSNLDDLLSSLELNFPAIFYNQVNIALELESSRSFQLHAQSIVDSLQKPV